MLEVRNALVAFAGASLASAVGEVREPEARSKKQEVAFYNFAHTFQNAPLVSCFYLNRRNSRTARTLQKQL